MRSVVIRGGIAFSNHPTPYIQQVIDSIRSWHTGEVILSTWTDQLPATHNLIGIDKVIYSDDPGPGPVQNFLRQVQSFQSGVSASTGSEILVTRSDICYFRDLFELRNRYPKKTKANLSAFTEKLIIGNMMTIYPRESSKQWGYPLVYRPSDWFHVGNREDITRMGSIFSDLQAMDHSALIKRHDAVYNTQNAICTESLWFKMVLNKYVNPNFDLDDWPDHLGMNALIDNFEVLNMITTARAINLNWTFQPQRLGCFIKEEEYLEEYKKLCE